MLRLPLLTVLLLSSVACLTDARAADRTLPGISDWESEPAQAEHAADERIRAAVHRWLATTLDSDVTPADVIRLLDRSDVTRRVQLERRQRAYGDMWRATVEVTIPRRAVAAWNADRSAELLRGRLVLLSRAALTAIIIAGISVGVRRWDERTRGYARRLIFLIVLPIVVGAVATIWLIR